MAIHQRQAIREAVQALLVGKTEAADRVFKSRVVPYKNIQLPAIAVYTRTEPVDPESIATAPRELTRNLQLVIEAVVIADADVDDRMDAIALEVERAMDVDETFGGVCGRSILSNTEIDLSATGERPMGAVALTYTVIYHTQAPDAADVQLDDLATVDVTTSLGGPVADGTGAVVDAGGGGGPVTVGDQAEDMLTNLDRGGA